MEKKKFRWIDESINIDFEIPGKVLRNSIAAAEEADLEGNYEYFAHAQNIDSDCKALVEAGRLTHKQWDLLCAKYREDVI